MSRSAVQHRYRVVPELGGVAGRVFGSSSVVVRCVDADERNAVAANLDGQLTATIHADESDYDVAAGLLPTLETKVGRILFDG